MQPFKSLSLCALAVGSIQAYSILSSSCDLASRRSLLKSAAALVAGSTLLTLNPLEASASGGATAGKYT